MHRILDDVRALLGRGEGLWLADGEDAAPEGMAVVGTSGSTGEPKLVLLSEDEIEAAIERLLAPPDHDTDGQ